MEVTARFHDRRKRNSSEISRSSVLGDALYRLLQWPVQFAVLNTNATVPHHILLEIAVSHFSIRAFDLNLTSLRAKDTAVLLSAQLYVIRSLIPMSVEGNPSSLSTFPTRRYIPTCKRNCEFGGNLTRWR